MVEKSPSLTSIGFPGLTESEEDKKVSQRTGFCSLGSICVFAIKCKHKKIPLFRIRNQTALWLPFVVMAGQQQKLSPKYLITELFVREQMLEPNDLIAQMSDYIVDEMKLVCVASLELPSELITQQIYCAKWNSSDGIECCINTNRIEWHSIRDVISDKLPNIWGKEVIRFAILLKTFDAMKVKCLTIESNRKETNRYLSFSVNSIDIKERCIAQCLQMARIDRLVATRLYSDFVQHCYPALLMSPLAFRHYLSLIKLNRELDNEEIDRTFIAMNFEELGFLSFREFLLGIAVSDPKSAQNELRNAYIFRYYDSNRDTLLEESDLVNIMTDILKIKKMAVNRETVTNEVSRILNIPGICNDRNQITFESLNNLWTVEPLTDIALLFRSTDSLADEIVKRNIYLPIEKTTKRTSIVRSVGQTGRCPQHKLKDYQISVHKLTLNRQSGRLDTPEDLRVIERGEIAFRRDKPSIVYLRKLSTDVTNKLSSLPNKVLSTIRELAHILSSGNQSPQTVRDYQIITIESLPIEVIEKICERALRIFQKEQRVVKTQSPVYVLGDIHGNLKDLVHYENTLWKTGPQCLPNVVFAGDYVDRGEYSVECALYLFAMKILNPNQFHPLRGNHEVKLVQKNFTFERECNFKYKELGPRVFELFNSVFDVLPIAAIIDDTIYCAHGGIPYSATTIAELLKIPNPLKNPEIDSPAAHEILWSDPIEQREYLASLVNQKLQFRSGYTTNNKRGTAYSYSEAAVDAFLKTNNLKLVIRAHEWQPEGHKFFHSGKVISVFSSSKYCGSSNTAAVILVDVKHNKESVIRIIEFKDYRLDQIR